LDRVGRDLTVVSLLKVDRVTELSPLEPGLSRISGSRFENEMPI
jgi:hypothetical protein